MFPGADTKLDFHEGSMLSTDLLESLRFYGGNGGPEASHTLGDVILGRLFQLLIIVVLMVEMSEMEAVDAVCV